MDLSLVVLLLFTVSECKGITSEAKSVNSTKPNEDEAISSRQAGYGLIKFEDNAEHEGDQYGVVTFTEGSLSNHPLKFEDAGAYTLLNQVNSNLVKEPFNNVVFKDDNSQNQNTGQKKRRKRRRKSRRFMNPVPNPGNNYLSSPGKPPPAKASVPMPPGPLRTLSDAFNDILANDDKQCVSRMICEQAATGSLLESSMAKSIATILQYLPVLQKMISYSAYPLFSAVGALALAMNSGQRSQDVNVCKNKYPQCPNDPEERLQYFNNHKGGLARFFRGNTQPQYTTDQFHNTLLNMGLTPHPYVNGHHNFPTITPKLMKYGVLRPSYTGNEGQQSFAYGLTKPTGQYTQIPNIYNKQRWPSNGKPVINNNGLPHPNTGYVNPSQTAYTNYGPANPHYRRFNSYEDTFSSNAKQNNNSNKNEIQKRIQNKPEVFVDENIDNDAQTNKWLFPKLESTINKPHYSQNKVENGRQLKFPDSKMQVEQNHVKQAEGFAFPGAQSNRQYLLGNDDSMIDSTGNEATGGLINTSDDANEGIEIVYVVRGNGDPRRPEIVKLRPGERIH